MKKNTKQLNDIFSLKPSRTVLLVKNHRAIFFAIFLLALFSLVFFVLSLTMKAAFTPVLNYQGKLMNVATGNTVTDGTYNMRFRIYDDLSAGSLLWTETRCFNSGTQASPSCSGTGSDQRVTVSKGLFAVLLGELNGISDLDFKKDIWLEVDIGGVGDTPSWETLAPRKRLSPVVSAMSLNGYTWEIPGQIGLTTPNTGKFTTTNVVGFGSAVAGTGTLTTSTTTVTCATTCAFMNQLYTGDKVTISGQTRIVAVAPANNTSFAITAAFSPEISAATAFTYQKTSLAVADSTGTAKFIIDQSGNVGIGTATPTNILSLGNAAAQKFWIEDTATDVAGEDLTIAAGGTIAGTSTDDVAGGGLILQSGLGTGTGVSTISFQTGTTLTTGKTLQTMETKMTILGNGNVGIGTAIPSQLLSVGASSQFTVDSTGNLGITKADPEIRLTDTGNSEYTRITRTDTLNLTSHKNRVSRPGAPGNALSLDGVDEYAWVASNSGHQLGTGDFTVVMWIKTTQAAKTMNGLLSRSRSGYATGWILYGNATNLVWEIRIGTGVGGTHSAYVPWNTINNGNWHLIVGTIVRAGYIRIYVDGTEVGTPEDISTWAAQTIVAGYASILGAAGANTSTSTPPLASSYTAATFDEVAIYKGRALTAPEISDLWNGGAALQIVAANNFPSTGVSMGTSLASVWHLDETTGTVVTDSVSAINMAATNTENADWVTGKVPAIAASTVESDYLTYKDGIDPGEGGIITLGNATYTPRIVLDGINYRFNIAGVEKVRIDASGNVGIGTASPGGLLHIATSTTALGLSIFEQASADADSYDLTFRKTRGTITSPTVITAGDELGVISFGGYSGAGGYVTGAAIKSISESTIATTRVPAYLSFWTGTDAAPTVLTERMRIDKVGNVGIGTTAPLRALDINEASGNALRLIYGDSDGSAVNYIDFLVSSGGVGSIVPSAGVLNVTGDVRPTTNNTYYLGKNSSSTPAAWKGVILKDTTNGTYYRIEIINGVVTATGL